MNGNETGLLIESCAGLLDKENVELHHSGETGYRVTSIQKIGEAYYMSPGSVTEMLYFYTAEYTDNMRVGDGGGLEEEQENIEVLEYSFEEAINMVVHHRVLMKW